MTCSAYSSPDVKAVLNHSGAGRAIAPAVAAGANAPVTGFTALQSGSTPEQKTARAGISTEQVKYIV